MVCSKEPAQLLKAVKNDGNFRISERYPGIYEITGEHFPVRLVVGKKLSVQDNIWIKNLNKGLTTREVLQIQEHNRKIRQWINMDAYIDVFMKANIERLRKELQDVIGFDIIKEWLVEDGWDKVLVAQAKEDAKAEGIAEGKAEGIETSMRILRELIQNESIEAIAERHQQPVSQIILYREILNGNSKIPAFK
jgi:hypothetical protein